MSQQPIGPQIDQVIRSRREELGLDLEDLAQLVGIEKSRLQVLEGGSKETPTFRELRELSRFLGVDLELYDPDEDEAPEALPEVVTLLKSHENYLQNQKWRTVVDAAEVAMETTNLERWLELPERYESLRANFHPRSLTNREPWRQGRLLAAEVREELGLGQEPIDSAYALCRHLGVLVIETFLSSGVSALCLADPDHGPTIVINVAGTNESLLPRRFAIAHEVCHILFDEYEFETLQHFDTAPDFYEAKNKPDIEKRADAFAINLLCPEGAFRAEWLRAEEDGLSVADSVRRLMERFGASFTAIKGHLQSLNLLSRERAESMSFVNTDTPAHFLDAERRANTTAYDDVFAALPRLRRGQFLERVLAAYLRDLITRSAALELLDVDGNTFDDHVGEWCTRLLDGE